MGGGLCAVIRLLGLVYSSSFCFVAARSSSNLLPNPTDALPHCLTFVGWTCLKRMLVVYEFMCQLNSCNIVL